MKTNDIRTAFLTYYKQHNHTVVPSSSLVPLNDPTLLFTNAGMVPFKETFLGVEKRDYVRATSSQRCVRAGGKHNDLENVGHTARHHTFFEMLGNFSFGDYFKREAIRFAWDFLTKNLNIPAEKLWITVYKDDQESEDIWLKEMNINPERFSRCGEADNFWSMGETGPCGPCTEIFYDHGEQIAGGPPGSPDEDADRYIEIWNLVFMQYNRDASGALTPLPKPCVDTGMGLERIAAVMQGVNNNYDIDLFESLLKSLSKIIDFKDISHPSMRVIVDHIRSSCFLIVDGVAPSNEGRGYVLRRIIRRALRHGHLLGMSEPFFYRLVPALCREMEDAYPELLTQKKHIQALLKQEENQFIKTLAKGLKLYDSMLKDLKGSVIPGEAVFLLYDTYGFPKDLTADMAREKNLTIDEAGFDACMKKQRAQSQQHQRFKVDQSAHLHLPGETRFTGYDKQVEEQVTVQALLVDNKPVSELTAGQVGVVVLDQTPFYAESGGQIGDTGYLSTDNGPRFKVNDTQKVGKVVLHWGELESGTLSAGATLKAEVDDARQVIRLNHSATHLLHEALRRVLGDHVTQKGSLVDASRLRFDFSHTGPVTTNELHAIERMVNQQIRANVPAQLKEVSLDEAKKTGAMALFGEKYADNVRVITMGDFSCEICGGTHVDRTGDIGFFKITNETACSAGVRRIEAVTGGVAIAHAEQLESRLNGIAKQLKVSPEESVSKIAQLMEQVKTQQRDIMKLQEQLVSGNATNLMDHVQEIAGIQVLSIQVPGVDRNALLKTMDQMKSKLPTSAIILATVKDNKAQVVAGVTKSCLSHFKAPDLLKQVTSQIAGRGGGRPDLAQGGGDDVSNLDAVLASVYDWVKDNA